MQQFCGRFTEKVWVNNEEFVFPYITKRLRFTLINLGLKPYIIIYVCKKRLVSVKETVAAKSE